MKILFLPPPRYKLIEDSGVISRIHISELGEVTSIDYIDIDEALTAYFGAYEAQVRKEGFSESTEGDGIDLNIGDQTVMFKIYEHDFKELCLKARKKEGLKKDARCYETGAYWAMLGIYDAFDTGMLPKESGEGLKKEVFSQYVTLRKTIEAQSAADRKKNALRVTLGESLSTAVKASKDCTDEDLIMLLLDILSVCLEENVTAEVIKNNRKELENGKSQ